MTIEAKHPTALEGIDDLVFTVTRSVASEDELEVPVTLSSGIIDDSLLSHTVTIDADETSAELTVGTDMLDPAAATGDVTATVGDGDAHDVGDPAAAAVRVHVGDTLVTVRLNAVSYSFGESVGTTGVIRLIARTEPGVPPPDNAIAVELVSDPVTATSGDDYEALDERLELGGESTDSWTSSGGGYRLERAVPFVVVDDALREGDERLVLRLRRAADTPGTVSLVIAGPGSTCDDGCQSAVVIVDDDNRSVDASASSLTVDEGGTGVYTVVLSRPPGGDVTVTPEVGGVQDAEIEVAAAVTFTQRDWDMPQTVTVTAQPTATERTARRPSPTPSPEPTTRSTT